MSEQRSVLWSPTNLIALIILVASCLWLAWWFYERSQYVYLDDARVASTMISISSRIPGWVVKLPISEGDHVKKGETLVAIDARDTKLQLQQTRAQLAELQAEYARKQAEIALTQKQVDTAITAARSNLDAAGSALRETAVTLGQAKKNLKRATSLLARKMTSQETFDNNKAAYDQAVQAHDKATADRAAARAGLAAAQANRQKMDVLDQERAMIVRSQDETKIAVKRLEVTLSDYVIASPIDGVIDEKFINRGEYVYPGQPILMLHDPDDLWIEANVKETEVRRVHMGSAATVTVDAYPGKVWRGHVSYVGNATTSQFAMLPAPNPSGNFTKITQRLQIKVRLRDDDPALKPGMMVELKIVSD